MPVYHHVCSGVHTTTYLSNLISQNIEYPESMSTEMKSLLSGLLQREVSKRLGCQGNG